MGNSPNSFRTGIGPTPIDVNVSQIPLWGRAWKLTVKTQSADQSTPSQEILTQDSWDPEALRMTFEVLQAANSSPYWYALVKIFNCNKVELQNLLFNAVWLTLEAGYQTGPSKYSQIWDGPVMQVIFDRENVVDLTVTFNCISTLAFLEEQFIGVSKGSFSTQYQFISDYIQNNLGGNPSDQISEYAAGLLKAKQYPRGKTYFGSGSKYVEQIAQDNFLSTWHKGGQPHISELSQTAVPDPEITYGPPYPPGANVPANQDPNITRSIIGVPRQSVFGSIFTVLLDPRLTVKVPPMAVKLDNTLITQLKTQPPNLPAILDNSGVFVVGQVRHYGDTRGTPWYSEVNGWAPAWAYKLLGTGAASAYAIQK
jgi:hypothetical protein